MKYVLASNWKANFTLEEAKIWFESIGSKYNEVRNEVRIIAAVPYVYVHYLSSYGIVDVFAQNVSHVKQGAFTGEVTVSMLKSINCKGCIVGHSERRHIFGENDDIINKKILSLQENSMEIIFCIGEKLEERKEGKTKEVLFNQIVNGLKDFERFDLLIVAYEPVWAIGTGVPIEIPDLIDAENFIRKIFKDNFNIDNLTLLYGGSVDKEFVKKIKQETTMNGALIGSASWKPDGFIQIIDNFINA